MSQARPRWPPLRSATMRLPWCQKLERGGVLVLDGGTGTELRRRGMALGAAAWSALASLTHFDLLRTIHADYIAAGADVITTNTFATTRFVLEAAGHRDDFTRINARAVAAAREARDMSGREVAIAGSISCLPPRFDAHAYPDESTERSAYLELAETLAEAGVDLLVLEMMQETRHAPLACAAARAVGLPIWLGVSCRLGAGGTLVGFDFPLVPLGDVPRRAAAVRAGCRVRHAQPGGGDRAGAARDSQPLARDRSAPTPRSATVRRGTALASVPQRSRRKRATGSRPARRSSAAAAARRRSTFARSRSCRAR